MRVMVGLTPPTSGTADDPRPPFADLPNPGREVGVLLDASAQHAGRTGREILTIAAAHDGPARVAVDEMLDRVSLTERRPSRRVRNYSLGMRQRLGIATALIGDPEVLILDEPANGLDPAGIRWMRDLLRDYADQGGTVLLSSHLLHEIEVIADDIVVIGNGRIVAQGTKAELLAAGRHLSAQRDPPSSADALEPRPASPSPVRRGRACAPTPTPPASARSPSPPASPSPSSAPPTAPAWRRCSSSSPPRPARHHRPKEQQHDHHDRHSSPQATARPHGTARRPIPARSRSTRIVGVELRKMFDTRSGFWLMASIGITAAARHRRGDPVRPRRRARPTTTFAAAIGFPMAVILPMIAILSVTSEWSQRSGLTTFTLVPHRGRVIAAKAIVAVGVGVVSMLRRARRSARSATSSGTAITGDRPGLGHLARRASR